MGPHEIRHVVVGCNAKPDFLDEVVDERAAHSPEFPLLVDAAEKRRQLLDALAERRRAGEQSQTAVAPAADALDAQG